MARRLTPVGAAAGPDAQRRHRGVAAWSGSAPPSLFARRGPLGARRRRRAAAAVAGRRLRRRRRRALHPPVQRDRCLAGRLHRPAQGVRLLRRPGLGRRRGRRSRLDAGGRPMLTLQTARHSIDYTFTAVKEDREGESGVLPLDEPGRRGGRGRRRRPAPAPCEASERSNRRPGVRWAKKALHLGIGERWLVISVLAAAGPARRPPWPSCSCLGCRVARLHARRAHPAHPDLAADRGAAAVGPRAARSVDAQADLAPVVPPAVAAGALTARPDRFLWLRPALLRAAEYTCVALVVAAVAPDGLPAGVRPPAGRGLAPLRRPLPRREPPRPAGGLVVLARARRSRAAWPPCCCSPPRAAACWWGACGCWPPCSASCTSWWSRCGCCARCGPPRPPAPEVTGG